MRGLAPFPPLYLPRAQLIRYLPLKMPHRLRTPAPAAKARGLRTITLHYREEGDAYRLWLSLAAEPPQGGIRSRRTIRSPSAACRADAYRARRAAGHVRAPHASRRYLASLQGEAVASIFAMCRYASESYRHALGAHRTACCWVIYITTQAFRALFSRLASRRSTLSRARHFSVNYGLRWQPRISKDSQSPIYPRADEALPPRRPGDYLMTRPGKARLFDEGFLSDVAHDARRPSGLHGDARDTRGYVRYDDEERKSYAISPPLPPTPFMAGLHGGARHSRYHAFISFQDSRLLSARVYGHCASHKSFTLLAAMPRARDNASEAAAGLIMRATFFGRLHLLMITTLRMPPF